MPSHTLVAKSSLYCSKHHITLLIKNKSLVSIRRNSYCVSNSSKLVKINMIITRNYFNIRTPLLKTERILTMKPYLNVTSLFTRELFLLGVFLTKLQVQKYCETFLNTKSHLTSKYYIFMYTYLQPLHHFLWSFLFFLLNVLYLNLDTIFHSIHKLFFFST